MSTLERESTADEEDENHQRRRAPELCLRFVVTVLFCVIKHPFCGSSPLTSSSFLPWPSNHVKLVPKPGTRKPARRRHATRQPHPTCGASQVARGSSSGVTSGAYGHEAGAGGSLPAIGPGAGWRPAGHPELARPGGNPSRSPIDRPRPAVEVGTPRWPGGLRGPLRKDSGGVWLGAQPVAGAPDPTADGGSAGSSPTVACRKPPGLWRPKAGHPSTRRPEPRAASSTLPLRGARGLRPTVRDGSAAPGRMPPVALGRGSDRPGGARAVRRLTTPANRPSGSSATARRRWPRPSSWRRTICRRAPGSASPGLISLSLSLFPHPSHLLLSLAPSQLPGSRLPVAPRAPPRSGNGQLREEQSDRYPRWGGGPEPTTSPQYSLRQSLAHPSAAGAAVRPGPACWGCGDPGHFQDQCPMMEVGLLVRVPDSPGAAPDQAGSTRYLWVSRGVHIRPWWIRAVTKPPSIKAWYNRGRWIRAARLRWGVYMGTWRITP